VEKRFQDLPNWTFWIEEVSPNAYRIKGKESKCGANLNFSGSDPEELIRLQKKLLPIRINKPAAK